MKHFEFVNERLFLDVIQLVNLIHNIPVLQFQSIL